MSETNVADRLKYFIESKGLTFSQFADTCGIPRPSLSQLLTGRNKKISDIMVGQIHNMFPELSIMWLLFGEGQMESWNSQDNRSPRKERVSEVNDGLFSMENEVGADTKRIIFKSSHQVSKENSQGERLKSYQDAAQSAEFKIEKLQSKIKELQAQIESLKKNPRKVSHITVYYEDSTFETFFPR